MFPDNHLILSRATLVRACVTLGNTYLAHSLPLSFTYLQQYQVLLASFFSLEARTNQHFFHRHPL